MGRGRWRGGQREGGDGERATAYGKGDKGEEEKKGQEEGDFTDGYAETPGGTYGMLGSNNAYNFF